jgi:glucokinase
MSLLMCGSEAVILSKMDSRIGSLNERMYIGVDIGKSKVAAGLLTGSGRIKSRAQVVTDMKRGGEAIVDQCRDLVHQMFEASAVKPSGIGIGSSGIVDHQRGVIVSSGTIPKWQNIEIRARFEKEFGVPVFIDNDVFVAALGEHFFGAGRGTNTCVFMVMSTGVGFCTIRDGAIWRGVHDLAGQIAHIELFGKGITVNDVLGGKGMADGASKLLGRQVTTEEVFRLASNGLPEAQQIVERATEGAALIIAWIQNSIDPEIFVIGGGVVLNEGSFLEAIRLRAEQFLAKYKAQLPNGIKIVPAALGGDAGIMGGVALCLRRGRSEHCATQE